MNFGKLFWTKEQRASHAILTRIMNLCPGVKEIFDRTGGVNIEIQVTPLGEGMGTDVVISAREQ
ncbi:hypothetical protein R6Y95_06165 [Methanoculleus palmolei]|uniref:Uncharacterized protein n=1 Tax=Methanoculleus palmolei TaxID=72612 RepID=A0ABD8A6F5_9EURY|nr:hypothetical protein R6Y95_06165 [Methanoculleus palmolei]